MPGSTQTFIAFHATMLRKEKMAICSFVRTKAAEPRLVALLPQEEEVDETGVQVRQCLLDEYRMQSCVYACCTLKYMWIQYPAVAMLLP